MKLYSETSLIQLCASHLMKTRLELLSIILKISLSAEWILLAKYYKISLSWSAGPGSQEI
jgi:hypothetical protein